MSPSSRPESAASMNPSDFATAPNTPGPNTPLPELGQESGTQAQTTPMPETAEPAAQEQSTIAPVSSEAAPMSGSPIPRQVHTPLPLADDTLEPPRMSYFNSGSGTSTPRDSMVASSFNNDSSNRLAGEKQAGTDPEETAAATEKRSPWYKRPVAWLAGLVALIVVILAIVLPVTLTKKHGTNGNAATSSGNGSGPSSGNGTGNPASPIGAITGGDGSVITAENGDNFTYSNKFGGFWVADPNDPFNTNAQVNSWTPPLNTSWTWGKDKVYGVNLGGLFVLEPFISPALFQKYPGATDEWSLSTLMAKDKANGGLDQIEDHYKTFITEADIAEIAGAGLNWIRLPIPFWAIETWEGEPFLAKVSWKYILKVLGWARKYGIRVNLDLHTIPGSQNGYNHSGKFGMVNFMYGTMGVANAQRALDYIRIITEFISQPEWQPVVPMFGIVNEALVSKIGKDQMTSFYLEAHNIIRNITGVGAGKGPYMSIHDGFGGISSWADFLPGSDRIIMDTHPYFAFGGGANTDPISSGTGANAGGIWPKQACSSWGGGINSSQSAFGVTVAGEFSNGFNDCGLFVRGVGGQTSYGGNCDKWQDASTWDAPTKAGIQAFAMASMDALQNWFFWTWKIGNSTAGIVESPLWSYQLGLHNGFMPTDPRAAVGKCAALGVKGPQFDGTYSAWQTGGAGAGTIAASDKSEFAWPPATVSGNDGDAAALPMYTPTGTVATLPPPTLTASATQSIDVGDGWYNTADNAGGVTVVQGCKYPNAWSANDAPVPTGCGQSDNAAAVAAAVITPAP